MPRLLPLPFSLSLFGCAPPVADPDPPPADPWADGCALDAPEFRVIDVGEVSVRVGILFPLFIGLLVPVRMGLQRIFKPEHLALLDAEEEPPEAEGRQTGL